MIFSVIICESMASTSVLRFVGPNSIQVWSFPWNSGNFLCKNPIFWWSLCVTIAIIRGMYVGIVGSCKIEIEGFSMLMNH